MVEHASLRERIEACPDIHALYRDISPSLPSGGELIALVEDLSTLRTERSALFLAEIHAGTADKAARKAVKKALYLLRTAGVKTPGIEDPGAKLYSPPGPPRSEAHASNVDGHGERLVFAFIPAGSGRNLALQFLLSDKRGIAELYAEELSRKKYSDRIAEMSNEGYLTIVATTMGHAAWLVERAAAITPETSEHLRQYRGMKHYFEGQQAPGRPVIYERLGEKVPAPPEKGGEGYLKLFELKEFGTWHADAPEADKWALDVAEATASKLVINEEQRKARIQEVMKDAARAFLAPERIAMLVSRLEENAFVLFETGLREEAGLAVSLALEMKKGGDGMAPGALSFVQTLVARSIMARMKKPAGDSRDSLVIPA